MGWGDGCGRVVIVSWPGAEEFLLSVAGRKPRRKCAQEGEANVGVTNTPRLK